MNTSEKMQLPTIEILGTHSDGTFIANILFEGKTVCAYYPAHLGNVLILHEYPDYVTRFVVFYENDINLYAACRSVLMREDLELEDKSETGLVDLFKRAMTQIRLVNERREPRFCKASEWVSSSWFKSVYLPKAIELLEKINNDPKLIDWCKKYSFYEKIDNHIELKEEIDWFFHATYAEGLVVTDYQNYLDDFRLKDNVVIIADKAWLEGLSLCQLLSVLAYHFRWDYHCNGSLINESIASGAMLRIIEELNRRESSDS